MSLIKKNFLWADFWVEEKVRERRLDIVVYESASTYLFLQKVWELTTKRWLVIFVYKMWENANIYLWKQFPL